MVRVAITAAALGWLARTVDIESVTAALQRTPPLVLAVPLLALLANAAIHSLRLHLLLRATGHPVAYPAVVDIVLRATFVGAVSPRGGADVARIAWLTRHTQAVEPVVAAAVVGRLLDLIPWLGMLSYGLLSGVLDNTPVLAASATAFAAAFTGVLIAALLLGLAGEAIAARLPVFRDRAVSIARATRLLGQRPRLLLGVTALSALVGALNVVSVSVVAAGFGATLPLSQAIGVVPAMDTVISLPVTISGVGLREGTFVLAFVPRGLTEDQAVAAALVRWSGELGRALIGGLVFLIGGSLPFHPPPSAHSSEPPPETTP